MEKILLQQKYHFATITPFRDYCNITDRETYKKFHKSEEENIFFREPLLPNRPINYFRIPQKKNTKVYYFTNNNGINEDAPFYHYKNNKHTFYTTKDRHIKRHFGRPFSTICVTQIERTIKVKGDKMYIKLYIGHRTRKFNCIYFQKTYNSYSIIFNLKNGNICVSESCKQNRKNKSHKIRVNNFSSVEKMITSTALFDMKNFSHKELKNDVNKIFDDEIFLKVVCNQLKLTEYDSVFKKNGKKFLLSLAKKFVELKNIKVPNHFTFELLRDFYPTEKYLKKNERKFVASILDFFGIKTKYTIKLIHKLADEIDMFGLYNICKILGSEYPKYLPSINESFFIKRKNYINGLEINKYTLIFSKEFPFLSSHEKENLIKIINDSTVAHHMNNFDVNLIIDHINMIEKVRAHGVTYLLRAKTTEKFKEEHRDLSILVQKINKGWVIEYIYDNKLIEDLQKPLQSYYFENPETEENPKVITLFPTVLTREEQYLEEGSFMHHCVANYADKDKSMIVSIRTEDGSDRVTCEFDIQTGNCLQMRHFCNQKPPDMFIGAYQDLTNKIKQKARFGTLNWKEKKQVPIIIDGVEIKRQLVRVNELYPHHNLPF